MFCNLVVFVSHSGKHGENQHDLLRTLARRLLPCNQPTYSLCVPSPGTVEKTAGVAFSALVQRCSVCVFTSFLQADLDSVKWVNGADCTAMGVAGDVGDVLGLNEFDLVYFESTGFTAQTIAFPATEVGGPYALCCEFGYYNEEHYISVPVNRLSTIFALTYTSSCVFLCSLNTGCMNHVNGHQTTFYCTGMHT